MPQWRRLKPMAKACNDMKSAETEDAALNALSDAEEVVRDQFLRENPIQEIESRALHRIDPLFSSKAWNALKLAVSSEADCICETDKALARLFRFASTCCRILRY